MKKILFLMTLFCALFASCGEDDKEEEVFALVGKSFAGENTLHIDGMELGDKSYTVINFISNKDIEVSIKRNSPTGEILKGPKRSTYSLNFPDMQIVMPDLGYEVYKEGTYDCEFWSTVSFFILTPPLRRTFYILEQ